MKTNRPYFLWDYDLSEDDVRRVLAAGSDMEKHWLIGRILEAARFDDVWRYLKLREVAAVFPHLKLREPIKRAWQKALHVWGVLAQ